MTDNPSLFTSPTSHFLRELTPRNLLSFGPEAQPIALERLNMLIGPNGSGKSKLIVTTHSDILVDAMTDQPDAVLVCEKHAGQTVMRRLDAQNLPSWLEKYRLGDLWTRGELGGTRW